MTKEKIGFIGVGLMGHGMATNIVTKGWPLTIMGHRNREPVEDLVARGATEAKTAREVAEASDIVFLCVTGSTQVEALVNGPDGLAAAGKKLVIVDCSTSDPSSTVRLAQALAPAGIDFIDAPLGRTPKEALAGTLDVMVGGPTTVIDRIEPVIAAFAGRILRTGPAGSGHTMKLLNNFLALGYASIYSEALALGAKAGINVKTFDSVIRGGRLDCGFYQTFMGWALDGNPEAHKFTMSNALKDMSYLAAAAQAQQLANPVGAAVRNSFALASGLGRGEEYVPFLADVIAEANGTKLK